MRAWGGRLFMSFQMQIKRMVQWEGGMGSLKAFQRKLERRIERNLGTYTSCPKNDTRRSTSNVDWNPWNSSSNKKAFLRFQFEKQQRSKWHCPEVLCQLFMFMKEGQAAPHTSHFLAAQAVRVQTWCSMFVNVSWCDGVLKRMKFNTHPFREATSKLGMKWWSWLNLST